MLPDFARECLYALGSEFFYRSVFFLFLEDIQSTVQMKKVLFVFIFLFPRESCF